MDFVKALEAIKLRLVVTRKKWQGKAKVYLVHNKLNNITHIEVRTLGSCLMYAASSEDLLATDWLMVDKEFSVKQLKQEEIIL